MSTLSTLSPCSLLILILAITPLQSWAEEGLDDASMEALYKTQQLLENEKLRADAISKSPNAQLVDAQARSLAGNEANTQAMYGLSSQILEELVRESGGDAEAMKKLLVEAKNNPKAFYERLNLKNRESVQKLSEKISDSPSMGRNPASK